ncbi:MAG: hypothetical protein A2233_02025 [Candidatus Kerfeldbacteria bacterium RIFOXYA2_FULL_38_24]|uniref:Cupin 2 conserved barrel domain-containing protein n=1 Tax=Candidatus Kerfeldbacteria bacterium RIFOXYB2_FULL_38_14 TaxID=1798547 RepID=A0A1G2BEN1_9BACT|nr:MAG: hypothetical protein A2319_04625 [Candidatus Kerfeldbacteria bacterium RIFOXYB2_FULL_38_14]OGY87893.1 MAG: hypothetical protein A2233_02025 [Candidatus Kerfeldbacteria bacterium RIFOXYA2_FULL_38_24]OGY88692.1 MAG: hypothetical protein A2458_03580 [Candidatus Kerfeldbacteria bacterium RIFOXYC2_FULL_38_9]
MLISKSDTEKISNSETCIVWEYRFPSKHVSFATAKINGRYPNNGTVANTECEEVYYVINGSGIIHSEFGDFEIGTGDVYHFSMGEKFYVEGNELDLVLVNAPSWKPEQHKELN